MHSLPRNTLDVIPRCLSSNPRGLHVENVPDATSQNDRSGFDPSAVSCETEDKDISLPWESRRVSTAKEQKRIADS
jgi:hypothetical protein